MCRLFETIQVRDRRLININYHNRRFNQSRLELFGIKENICLENIISLPDTLNDKIYKCRLNYSQTINEITYSEYIPKIISTLRIVFCDDISYNYKYENRIYLKTLLRQAGTDDILIIKNGFVTDSSFANIIFFDGLKWHTPSTPLLMGTKRSFLLDTGAVTESEIHYKDIRLFHSSRLINAMLDPDESSDILTDQIINF